MTTSDLKYPVIVIGPEGGVGVSVDEETLTTSTSTSLKSGGYNGCVVIDSDMRGFRVTNTRYVRGHGPLWGYCLFERIITVDIQLEPFDFTFDEIKKKTLRYMKQGLSSIADPNYCLEEMRKVKEADNLDQLIEYLLPYYDDREIIKFTRGPMLQWLISRKTQ